MPGHIASPCAPRSILLGAALVLISVLVAATPASARLTDSFVTAGNAQARWIAEPDVPPGATDGTSVALAVKALTPIDFNDGAWVTFRGFSRTPPASPPSFLYRISQTGSSGGSVRMVIRFSDGGFGFLRPVTFQANQWALADGAGQDWESQGGNVACGSPLTYAAMLACHPGAAVTGLDIINDSGWLYNGRFEALVDNINYGGEIVTRPAPPVLGASLNGSRVSGRVLVRQPQEATASQAQAGTPPRRSDLDRVDGIVQGLPVGTTVDARRGTIRLTAAKGRGRGRQAGRFSGAVFKVEQIKRGRSRGLTTLRLDDDSRQRCNIGHARRSSARRPLAGAARHRRALLRRLRARARGRFRTRGRYSSAIVRGTRWTMEDRCEGTLVSVHDGKVVVRDLLRRRTVLVGARQKYLARAPGY